MTNAVVLRRRVTGTVHGRRPGKRSALRVLLVLLAVAGLAAASGLTVTQKTLTGLYAERFSVSDGFALGSSQVWPAVTALSSNAQEGSPVKFGATPLDAQTAVTADHWVYALPVMESSADSVTVGSYSVELSLNGASVGKVFLEKAAADAGSPSGARAVFDIGPALAPSSLLYAVVQPVVHTGPTVEYDLHSETPSAGKEIWKGDKPDAVKGQVNPSLKVALGSTLKIVATYGDNPPDENHNLGITKSTSTADKKSPLAGWTDDIGSDNKQATLIWVPSAAGNYAYGCKYHPNQWGTITVS